MGPTDNTIDKGVKLDKANLTHEPKTYLLAIKMTPPYQILLFNSDGSISGGLPRVKDTTPVCRMTEYVNPKNMNKFSRQRSQIYNNQNNNSASNFNEKKEVGWCQ